jgi:hypothetical protein
MASISISNVTQSGAVDVKNTVLELSELSVANTVILLSFAFEVQSDNPTAFYNNLSSKNSNYTIIHRLITKAMPPLQTIMTLKLPNNGLNEECNIVGILFGSGYHCSLLVYT